MSHIIKFAARHPWLILTFLMAATAIAASQLRHLHIAISAESMLEKGTPAWNYLLDTEATFGSEEIAIVVLRDPDIFQPARLAAIRGLIAQVEELPDVTATSSLFNVANLRNVDGIIHAEPFLAELPAGADEAARVQGEAIRNPLVLGNLISADGQTLAINLILARTPGDADFDRRVSSAIDELIAPLRGQVADVYQVGISAMRADLTAKIRGDQSVFLPLSVGVLLLILAVSLRRVAAAVIPLATAGISVVWTLGFMAWLGIPVNIMTSIVPALVIVIGSTEDIHLLAECGVGFGGGQTPWQAIDRMADNMGVAVLLTFVTTYVGFLSIALNDIEILSQFGLVASSGLLFNFLITVVLVPVLLRWLGPRWARPATAAAAGGWYQRFAVGLTDWVQRRRRFVQILAAMVVVAALFPATQLRINNSLMDYLDADSSLRANAERVHAELSGVHSLSIVVDSGIQDTFLQVRYLEEILKIQAFLEEMGRFDRSFSFANFIMLVNGVMGDGGDQALRLPESSDIVREYMLFIKPKDVASYVSPTYDRTRILVRHNISDSDALNDAVAEVRAYLSQHIDPALRVEITGKAVLSNKAVEEMARGQLQSLLLVGVVVVVLVSVLFISLRAGLIALVANLFPVTVLFGVMGLANIPLNAGTSMVAAIALGICVDDTMHVMSRFHEELRRHEQRSKALAATMRAEALPIFATSIALAAGFAVFATSSFQPVVDFGLLSAMVILIALATTFVLMPLLLSSTQLMTVWDLLSYRVQNEALRRSPLFQGMYVWQIKKLLLASEIRLVQAGQVLIKTGEMGSEMFVVLEGRLEARKLLEDGGYKCLRVLATGDLFGEIGPLSGAPRTADVVAFSDAQVLVLSWDRIDRLTRMFPILAFKLFRNLTRIIGARLRQTAEYAAGTVAGQTTEG